MIFDDFCAFVRGLKGNIWWFPTMRYDVYIYIYWFYDYKSKFLDSDLPYCEDSHRCGAA